MLNESSSLDKTIIDKSAYFSDTLDGENLDYNFIKRKRSNRFLIKVGNREYTRNLKNALSEAIKENEELMQRIEDSEKLKHVLISDIHILTDLIVNQGKNINRNQESSTSLTDNENN